MSEDKNQDYLQKMIDEITKYEKCLDGFESWFKKLDYNQVKDKDWYQKIESAVINHLAKKNYKKQFTGHNDAYSIKIEDERIYQELKIISKLNVSEFNNVDTYIITTKDKIDQEISKYKSNIDKLRKKLFERIDGIDQTYLNNIFSDTLDKFEGQNRDDTPAKFIYGQTKDVAIKYEGIYHSSEPRSFEDSDKFRTEIFKIVNRLELFKTKAKKSFSQEKSFDITREPVIDFWSLIWLENFIPESKDYFKKDSDGRKNHKLKKLFSYVPSSSINAENLSKTNRYKNSFVWRNIISKQDNSIPEENKQMIFCSLVEFYGKDFFNKLPEEEKIYIQEFYKNNPEFKLSDPSILGNLVGKNKNDEILNAKIKVMQGKFDAENLLTNKKEILITNNNIKLKSKKTKKSYTKPRIGIATLVVFFVISLILAWQVNIYILIASAILLAIFIVCLIELKNNGFECKKILCFCMSVENEPEKEISRDNDLSNPELNKTEIHIKS